MSRLKQYLKYLILFTNFIFITALHAEENIDFNFGKNIDQNIVAKLDIDINALGSNLPKLNFEEKLNKETISKINSNNKNSFINNRNEDQNNIGNSSKNKISKLLFNLSQKLNKKKKELN